MAGAESYFLKDEAPLKIHKILKEVYNSEVLMTPNFAEKTLSLINNGGRKQHSIYIIEDYELAILKQLSLGNSYRQIANQFHINSTTIKMEIKNCLEKLRFNWSKNQGSN
jgi:DNA-binding NarL/FixJ family response regulator